MQIKVEQTIIEVVTYLNEEWRHPSLIAPKLDTLLFGPDGCLKSLELVTLIAEIETAIYEQFQADIILADERAMSMENSPFLSIQSLSNFVQQLLEE